MTQSFGMVIAVKLTHITLRLKMRVFARKNLNKMAYRQKYTAFFIELMVIPFQLVYTILERQVSEIF